VTIYWLPSNGAITQCGRKAHAIKAGRTSRVQHGDRPPRLPNTRWLQDHIWNMFTKCWSVKREQQWDVHAMCNQFSTPSIQGVPNTELGNHHASPDNNVDWWVHSPFLDDGITQTSNVATAAPPEDSPPVPLPAKLESNCSRRSRTGPVHQQVVESLL